MIISVKLETFAGLNEIGIINTFESLFSNSYVISFVCSILAVVTIYCFQIQYSKRMLKKDFRCNEIINDVYHGIDDFYALENKIPQRDSTMSDEDARIRLQKNALAFIKFYEKNKVEIDEIALSLSYENNYILIESVQSCFFINLNFKLLSIVNHIKNRLPNIRENHPKIKELFEKYKSEEQDEDLLSLGFSLSSFYIDLRFMAAYWKELFDYLEYDPSYIRMVIEAYRAKYKIEEDIRKPVEILHSRIATIDKEVKKAIRKNTLRQFWHK